MLRIRPSLLVMLSVLLLAPPVSGEEPPQPNPERISYAAPNRYLALPASLGEAQALKDLARQLKRPQSGATLRAIWTWIQRNLPLHKPEEASVWRSVSTMIAASQRSGEGEAAVAFGALLRAAGIPAVWVKTVDVRWIQASAGGSAKASAVSGRVFLEVHLDGAWRLLDPVAMRLYSRYDTKSRLLPGGRLAYDKGGDAHALVLPNRQALYAKQARAHFARFDPRRLPWGDSEDLLASIKVFIAGDGSVSRYARATCEALGFLVEKSFTSGFAQLRPQMRGKILIVTANGSTPAIPKQHWARVLPPGYEALLRSGSTPPGRDYLSHRLGDGTYVIFTTATEYAAVEVAVARALSEAK